MSELSSEGLKICVRVECHTQLTLFQPGGTDYAHLITTGPPGFSDLLTAQVDWLWKMSKAESL